MSFTLRSPSSTQPRRGLELDNSGIRTKAPARTPTRAPERSRSVSLDVTPDLLESAERGEIDEADFIQCVRTSLPYAWDTISLRVAEFRVSASTPLADN